MIPVNDKKLLEKLHFDILDPTKTWPQDVVPLNEIGEIELN